MKKIIYISFHIVFILIFASAVCSAQTIQEKSDEDILKATMQYKDYMFLNNGAYGSLNPTFMRDLPLGQLATLQVSYGAGMGDFHKLDKSGDVRDLLVEVYGVKKLESVSFEGGMSYRNGKEKQRRWNSTLYQAEDNPFILADSVFSNYTVEQFTLDGRFSWEPLDLLRFGINALYEVGATSDEQDPRLETKGMRFTINPGIDFKVSKHVKIGATGGVRLFNENSRYSTVETAINSSFFVMKGFGLSLNNGGTSYQRETKGTAWFAALQVYMNRPGYTNFLNGGIEQNREKAIDGGTTQQFVGGEYRTRKIFVNDRFSFAKNKYVHNIEVFGGYDKVEGIWYDQKYITNSRGQSYWEPKLKSIIYTQDLWQTALKYRFDVLNAGNTPSWTVSAGVKYANSDIKNYPDGYKQSYQNLDANISLSKHFSIKKAVLSLSALGNYMVNLETGLLLGDDIELKDKYTIPMYNYITSDSYSVQGRIETKIPVMSKRFTSYVGAYVEASTQRYVGDNNMFRLTHFNRFSGGVNYTF